MPEERERGGHFVWDGREAHIVIEQEPRTLCGAWPATGFPTTEDPDAPVCRECAGSVSWSRGPGA